MVNDKPIAGKTGLSMFGLVLILPLYQNKMQTSINTSHQLRSRPERSRGKGWGAYKLPVVMFIFLNDLYANYS